MLCCLSIKQIHVPVAFELQHSMHHSKYPGMTVHGMDRVSHAMCESAELHTYPGRGLRISKPCQYSPFTFDQLRNHYSLIMFMLQPMSACSYMLYVQVP